MSGIRRDYSVVGAESVRAAERGLAGAIWFQPVIDPDILRTLQIRTNSRAGRDAVVWITLLIGAAVLAWWSLWTWWSIPAFALYGALYGGAADARWHECGHGTAFRSGLANDAIYVVASFMLLRGPTMWRWSHYRHHTDTIIVGRDPEIVYERPSNVWRAAFAFTHLKSGPQMFWRLIKHAFGRIDDDTREFVPEGEFGKVRRESRVFVAILVTVAAWSVVARTITPLLFIGLPSIYGAWLMVFFGITQHAGMREDVLDHRLDSRSVLMNPIFRFLYLNMNYHVEHHIFPSVPYHALPLLHVEIKDQLAPIKRCTWAAYREIWSTLWRQQHDPTYELTLDLPLVDANHRVVVGASNWVHRPDGSFDLGAVESLTRDEMRRIDVGERTFVLGRLDEGEIVLADGLCTHQQVHLCDGAIVDGAIECPKHNGRFAARTGEPVRGPARVPLTTYQVEIVNGRITSKLEVREPTRSRP